MSFSYLLRHIFCIALVGKPVFWERGMGVGGNIPIESFGCEDVLMDAPLMWCQAMSGDSDIL